MKAIYKHKPSGDLFAIETDAAGQVIAACGPLPIRSSHLLTFTPSHLHTFKLSHPRTSSSGCNCPPPDAEFCKKS